MLPASPALTRASSRQINNRVNKISEAFFTVIAVLAASFTALEAANRTGATAAGFLPCSSWVRLTVLD
ncbi:MAG: hypothetical protein ACREDV_07270, partial [Methylocella sp.]